MEVQCFWTQAVSTATSTRGAMTCLRCSASNTSSSAARPVASRLHHADTMSSNRRRVNFSANTPRLKTQNTPRSV